MVDRAAHKARVQWKGPGNDIKDVLTAWLADNNTGDWTLGIRFVQFQKNSSLHAGLKRSPYEDLLGCLAKIGLISSPLPDDISERLETEDGLLRLISNPTSANVNNPTSSTSTTPPRQITTILPPQ